MNIEALQERFYDFLNRINITQSQYSLWHEIEAHYREKHRYYHTLEHLESLFELYDQIEPYLNFPDEVEAAIWYHDLIYITQQDNKIDNETVSAQIARDRLQDSILDIDFVTNLILLTKTHSHPENVDEQYFLDMGLSILGQEPSLYKEYMIGITKEFGSIHPELYARGRMQFLQTTLQKDKIYHSEIFSLMFEEQAKKNIQNELSALNNVLQRYQKQLTFKPS